LAGANRSALMPSPPLCQSALACVGCKDVQITPGGGCLEITPRAIDDSEVLTDEPPRWFPSDPIPDPLGLPYGVPRLPRAPLQVSKIGASSSPAFEAIEQCPAGHTLVDYIARPGACDGCKGSVQPGQHVMDCRPCNWYLCDSCSGCPKNTEVLAAPVQNTMADGAEGSEEVAVEEAQPQQEEKARPGCTPCKKTEPDPEANQDEEPDPDAAKPSIFTRCCTNADRELGEDEILNGACWCCYCCCAGLGCGEFVHQKCMLSVPFSKCECEDTECGGFEGCSSCITSCCCLHLLCHLPPRHRSPVCVCLGEMYGVPHNDETPEQIEKDARDFEDDKIDDNVYNFILNEAFTVCYLKFCGFAFNQGDQKHGICSTLCKCANCKFEGETGLHSAASEDEWVCCAGLATCLWLYWFCSVPPPQENNPYMACLGCRFHHMHQLWFEPKS